MKFLLQTATLKNFFQVFRFGIVGVSAALSNYLVVVALVEFLHWSPLISNVIGFLLAIQVSYLGHRFWTFSHKQHSLDSLPKFILVSVVGFVINEALFALLLGYTALPYTISLIIAILTAAIFTFCCGRFWVFK